jgi:hypothetical protein
MSARVQLELYGTLVLLCIMREYVYNVKRYSSACRHACDAA